MTPEGGKPRREKRWKNTLNGNKKWLAWWAVLHICIWILCSHFQLFSDTLYVSSQQHQSQPHFQWCNSQWFKITSPPSCFLITLHVWVMCPSNTNFSLFERLLLLLLPTSGTKQFKGDCFLSTPVVVWCRWRCGGKHPEWDGRRRSRGMERGGLPSEPGRTMLRRRMLERCPRVLVKLSCSPIFAHRGPVFPLQRDGGFWALLFTKVFGRAGGAGPRRGPPRFILNLGILLFLYFVNSSNICK